MVFWAVCLWSQAGGSTMIVAFWLKPLRVFWRKHTVWERPSRFVARRCHCSSGVTDPLRPISEVLGCPLSAGVVGYSKAWPLSCMATGAALELCRILIDIYTSKEKMPMRTKCVAPQKGPFCIQSGYAVLWCWGFLPLGICVCMGLPGAAVRAALVPFTS